MLRISVSVLYDNVLNTEIHIRIYARIDNFITFIAVQRS